MLEVIFHGKMPDPFRKEDGTRVSPEAWPEYKKGLLNKIVDMEYGGMPPRPEYVRVEKLNDFHRGIISNWYMVHAGTKEKQVSFMLELYVPYVPGISPGPGPNASFDPNEKYPVLLTGDACYSNLEHAVVEEIQSRGFIAAKFNRLALANDVHGSREGGIHDIYPGNYSDISAWAWGYQVCIDAFEQISFVDETEVAITGHSRGGKTVMLAAAVDERVKYVCPNNSGCHGANSYRCEVPKQDSVPKRHETLADMLKTFPTWMGEKLTPYADCVEKLPYDMHYFGAMIAPRYYLQCEGMQDYWGNPIGAWQNLQAVKACYQYLGCEDHAAGWFRSGGHHHQLSGFAEFLDFVVRSRDGLPMREHLKINPYPDVPLNFDW